MSAKTKTKTAQPKRRKARSPRTKGTPAKRERFLALLRTLGNVTLACKRSGFPRTSAYELYDEDAAFKAGWDEATNAYIDSLEAEADRRAVKGTLRPVYHQGQQCGSVREYSDTLLIFRLKSLRPNKYRDNAQVTVKGNGPAGEIQIGGVFAGISTDALRLMVLALSAPAPDPALIDQGDGQ